LGFRNQFLTLWYGTLSSSAVSAIVRLPRPNILRTTSSLKAWLYFVKFIASVQIRGDNYAETEGDWLAQNLFGSLDEVQLGATAWLWIYNNERPNMALGGIT